MIAYNRFAQALEVVPRVLAENSGVKAKEVISSLYAAHAEGKKNVGFDIEGEAGDVKVYFYSFFFTILTNVCFLNSLCVEPFIN